MGPDKDAEIARLRGLLGRASEALSALADEAEASLWISYSSETEDHGWKNGDPYNFEAIDSRQSYAEMTLADKRINEGRALKAEIDEARAPTPQPKP